MPRVLYMLPGSILSFAEAVADVSDRLDKGVAGVFNLASQSADVDIHGSVAAVVVITPDFIE